ncbi:MAG: flagellar protein FlaG [Spirochaetales bacterium]|jgi:flagellar protein FlaG|nr:flagellar protein FlaG [Spirochaetales bacterium]
MTLEIVGVPANGMAALPGMQTGRRTVQLSKPVVHAPEKKKVDPALIQNAVRDIEKFSSVLNRRLKYSVNKELDQVVVKVIDSATDKVIKVLPPEELQRLHSRIRETIGLLFDETI